MHFKDLAGKRFGRLFVLRQAERVRGRIQWLCKCDCGGSNIVDTATLNSGKTQSCGCYATERRKSQIRNTVPAEQRFYSRVFPVSESGCWIWAGDLDKSGYGTFFYNKKLYKAHRASYEMHVGPIPEGLTIDHLCRVRCCVNPAHLEPVTNRENNMRSPIQPSAVNSRKTHCVNGHEFNKENTVWLNGRSGRKVRACRACRRVAMRRHDAKRRPRKPNTHR